MTAAKTEADLRRNPSEPAARQANGSAHTKSHEFARRAKAMISELPSSLDAQVKRRPYATLGIALAIGVGTGILLGSRILRSVLASAASFAAIELGRAYLRQAVPGVFPHPSD
jgi:ElaB/YqjD/DUF883 family membrane-anchored ribosome-binding protein